MTSSPQPRVVLVAGGPLTRAEVRLLQGDLAAAVPPLVIGVDGGARHVTALGFVPDVVTGDFDSLDDAERVVLENRGAQIVPTPDQDYTDLDKALAYAINERGARSIRVFAATGGRLDHTFAALSTLVKYGKAFPALRLHLVDGHGITQPLQPGTTTLRGDDLPGRVLSLLALGPVAGVTTTGVRWPLTGESLEPGVRDGTSNEVTAEVVTIRFAAGNLLVMLHHGLTYE